MTNTSALDAERFGDDPWAEQVRKSDRPEDLIALMLLIDSQVVSLYGPSSGHKAVGFKATPIGAGAAAADKLSLSIFDRLDRSRQRAGKVIRNKSVELAAKLAAYVKERTGFAGDINAELARINFSNRVERYLESGVNDLKPYAQSAVQAWLASDNSIGQLREMLQPVLGRASAQAQMVVRTEMQNSYVDMMREAMAGQSTIERLVAPGACALCKSRAGVQPYSEDALWTHPNCACTWRAAATERQESPALFRGWPVVLVNV